MIRFSDSQWLDISTRRVEHNLVNIRLKGPLYAASAIFKRSISDDRWVVDATIDASLPLRKKWSASLYAEGQSGNGGLAQVYREKVSSRESEIQWHRPVAAGQVGVIELLVEHSALRFNLSNRDPLREVPAVSAAELPFLIQDVWVPEASAKSLFVFAGRRLHAVSLRAQGKAAISGVIASVEANNSSSDWHGILSEALSKHGREFEFGWDDRRRCLTDLRVKVPLLGAIKMDFI